MPKNSRFLIVVEEILLAVVLLFTLWGAIKGAYVGLIVTAIVAFMMVRQWRVLQAMNAPEDDEEEDTESDDEDEE